MDVGVGFLEIEAQSGAALAVPVELVVDDDVVTKIELRKETSEDRIVVRARAFARATPVLGAHCDWSLTLASGSLFIADSDGDEANVRGLGAGTLTCEIGNISRSVGLRLD
jgi:hypothetical protein